MLIYRSLFVFALLTLGLMVAKAAFLSGENATAPPHNGNSKIQPLMAAGTLGQPQDLTPRLSPSLSSGPQAAPAAPAELQDQDYQQRVQKLRQKWEPEGFHVALQKPFVVIGNQDADSVQRWAEGTVKWAVDRLKKQYFDRNPNKIVDIWLLKDKDSYLKQCKTIVGYQPSTPFGFYSRPHSVLMMNISTGGGTLVHEIVHPFMESNFPACPSWFNEGLASLYEQSSSNQNNQIVGLTNWRLRGLQLAIQDESVPTFKTLCSTTTEQFYRQDPGTNYSQARYLCYYLQQQGKLGDYYKEFTQNAESDPSGYQTLQKVLKVDDMDQFQSDWQKYVMTLRFGN